jgi:hypothetical protein
MDSQAEPGGSDVIGQRGADPPQRLGVRSFGRTETEPSGGAAGGVQQERLALAAASGDHTESRGRLRIGDESPSADHS